MKKFFLIYLLLLSNISFAEDKVIKIVYNGIPNVLEKDSKEYNRLNWLIYQRHLKEMIRYDSEFIGVSVLLEKIEEDKENNTLTVYLK